MYLFIFHPINIYKNLHLRDLMNHNKNNPHHHHHYYCYDFFKISIYKSKYEKNNFMLIIYPQEYHFFIENDQLIYHPNNKYLDGILKQYFCDDDDDFELAYNINLNVSSPKVICHKKLNFLKRNVYADKSTYIKTFDELQNPINAIKKIIADIIKNNNNNATTTTINESI